jgi:hypothetical protein
LRNRLDNFEPARQNYIGLFVGASKDNPEILGELQLPPDNEIYSVLIMGYPRLKFHYTVDRKPIKTRWE